MRKPQKSAARRRAGGFCEYCLLSEQFSFSPFQVDHVIARQHRGASSLPNLAFACLGRNSHKGTNLSSVDPLTGQIVRLFNPREASWSEHFVLRADGTVRGRTAEGRATARLLRMNELDSPAARRVLLIRGILITGVGRAKQYFQ